MTGEFNEDVRLLNRLEKLQQEREERDRFHELEAKVNDLEKRFEKLASKLV
jgi:hypothetical protein